MKAIGGLLIAVGVLALARVVTGERSASAPAAALPPLATKFVLHSVTPPVGSVLIWRGTAREDARPTRQAKLGHYPPVRDLDRGLPANRTVFRLPAWLDRPDYPGLVRPVNPPRPVPPSVGALPQRTPLILPVLPPRRAG